MKAEFKQDSLQMDSNQSRTKSNLSANIGGNIKDNFVCSICGDRFGVERQFYGHLRIHTGDVQWRCSQCPDAAKTTFETQSQLKKHENLYHDVVRPFKCSGCDQVFDRVSQLDNHRRSVHHQERSHVCQICGKAFFRQTDLRTHLNIHLGTNKCICEVCGRKFNHVSNLIRHSRTHAGVKPYPCTVCGKRFTQVNTLVRHKTTHDSGEESLECYFCEKQYKRETGLKEHMKKSHGYTWSTNKEQNKIIKRQHYCKICGESFQFVQLLKQHERVHQNVENLECKSCEKIFQNMVELKEHSCGVPRFQKNSKTKLKIISSSQNSVETVEHEKIKSISTRDNECVLTQLEDNNDDTSIAEFITRNDMTESQSNNKNQCILGKDFVSQFEDTQAKETIVYLTPDQFTNMNFKQIEDTTNNFIHEHLMELATENSVRGNAIYMETEREVIISDILDSYSKEIEIPNTNRVELNQNTRHKNNESNVIYIHTSENDGFTLFTKGVNMVRNVKLDLISEKHEDDKNDVNQIENLTLQVDQSQSQISNATQRERLERSHILEPMEKETINLKSVNYKLNKKCVDVLVIEGTDANEERIQNQQQFFIEPCNAEDSKNDQIEIHESEKENSTLKTGNCFLPDGIQNGQKDSNVVKALYSSNAGTNAFTSYHGLEKIFQGDPTTKSARINRNSDDSSDLKFVNAKSDRPEPVLRLVQTETGQQFYELVISGSPEKSKKFRDAEKTTKTDYYEKSRTNDKDPALDHSLKFIQTENEQPFFELVRSVSLEKSHSTQEIARDDKTENFMLAYQGSRLESHDPLEIPQNICIANETQTENLPQSRNDQFFFLTQRNKDGLIDNFPVESQNIQEADGTSSNSVTDEFMQSVSQTHFENFQSNGIETIKDLSAQDKHTGQFFEFVQDDNQNIDDNSEKSTKQTERPPVLRLVQNEDGEQFFELVHGDMEFEESQNFELLRPAPSVQLANGILNINERTDIQSNESINSDLLIQTGGSSLVVTVNDLQSRQISDVNSINVNSVTSIKSILDNAVPKTRKQKTAVKKYHCEVCEKRFSKGYNYRQHIGTHFADQQKFKCQECGMHFAWKSTLNKHMVTHKSDCQQKFVCEICPKVYTTLSQVNEHVKRDHLKERNHRCSYCAKTFFKKFDMKTHIRTHTKERPYICRACGKSFHHPSHIIRHERIHSGERPYTCNICQRTFTQLGSLKVHKQRHQKTEIDILDYQMDEDDPLLLSDL